MTKIENPVKILGFALCLSIVFAVPVAAIEDFPYIFYGSQGLKTLTEMCSQGKDQGSCIQDPGFVDPDGPDNIHGTADDDYRLDPKKASDALCCDNGKIIAIPANVVPTKLPSTVPPLVIEAQDMAVKNCANGKPVTNGYCCLGPGYLAHNLEFNDREINLEIIAKGDYAGGAWPIMEIRLDQVKVKSIEIDSADWKLFKLNLPAPAAGSHELSFAFINDWHQSSQDPPDRNFYLSKVTISQEPAAILPTTRDLLVEYDFTEISGAIIHDRATNPLDLAIPDATKIEWLDPGLRVKEATLVKTTGARTKLNPGIFFSKGFTVEVWVKPLNNTQGGPARIVSFSQDSGNRNFTLGQSGEHYEQRFRTSLNPGNGNNPATITPAMSIAATPVLQHVVYTRSETGTSSFYIDSLKVQTIAVPGDGSNWDMSYGFGLFNELDFPGTTRTWLGDIFLVRIYGDDLNVAEITQNFKAGLSTVPTEPTTAVTVVWEANSPEDNVKGYKIYYGPQSRFDSSLDPAAILAEAQKRCGTEPTQECLDSWANYCKPPDLLCDYDYFDYEHTVDVGNVLTHTLNLPVGNFYIAATAYNEKARPYGESRYSIELEVVAKKPGSLAAPQNFKYISQNLNH